MIEKVLEDENQQRCCSNVADRSSTMPGEEPQKTSIKSKMSANSPKLRRQKSDQRFSEVEGVVVPSDQAYLDMSLHAGARFSCRNLPVSSDWEELTTVNTTSRKIIYKESRQACYAVTHTVYYNGEPIWRIQTECKYDIKGTSGQSASCTLMKSRGIIRVKILHKGKTCLGQGRNCTEIRNYDLIGMIIESGEARRRELSCLE
jgi:hypothetical protein